MYSKSSFNVIVRCLLPGLLLFSSLFVRAQLLTTVSGGTIGDGKVATSIGIIDFSGLVADSSGNLYVIDRVNTRIRKIDAFTGVINTVAGGGTAILTDTNSALLIRFNSLTCIAGITDDSNNIYIGDFNRIYRLELSTGLIIRIAGKLNGFSGDGGPAIDAGMGNVTSMATDTAGNLYFTDGNRVRKVAKSTGIITTIAGTGAVGYTGDGGPAINAQFGNPKSITTDSTGNIYLNDNNNNVIRKIDISGIVTTVVGTGASGFSGDGSAATAATINHPFALKADAHGNLYLSDNGRIRKVTAATGIITTIAGTASSGYSGDGGPAAVAQLYNPRELAVSATGNIYLSDNSNYVIRKIDVLTDTISTVAGNHTVGTSGIGGLSVDAQLYTPQSIAVDHSGNIYLSDISNYRIYRIDAVTQLISIVAGTGVQGLNHGNGGLATAANISSPRGIATDTAGNFYFSDDGIAIRKVAISTGIVTRVAGTGTSVTYSGDGGLATSAAINFAQGIAIDNAGNIYIADRDNQRIRKVTAATGIITTIAGSGTSGYTGDGGPATAARLRQPIGVAVDTVGNVFISDNGNHAIRRVDVATGIITTIAGTGTAGYSGDGGLGTASRLRAPYGITTDVAGNIYIADQANGRIRKIEAATGIINTVVGDGIGRFNGDSLAATVGSLNNPTGVALDTAGNIYIADYANYRIRKVTVITEGLLTMKRITSGMLSADNTKLAMYSYPNPFTSTIRLSGLSTSTSYIISVYNNIGVLVASQKITGSSSGTIQAHAWSTGTYWLRIVDAGKNKVVGVIPALKQ